MNSLNQALFIFLLMLLAVSCSSEKLKPQEEIKIKVDEVGNFWMQGERMELLVTTITYWIGGGVNISESRAAENIERKTEGIIIYNFIPTWEQTHS